MPSSKKAKKAMVSALPTEIRTVYDLGSGWGGVLFYLARAHPEAQVHGFEISWLPWLYTFACIKLMRMKNIQLHRQNFYKASLSDADALVCYLYPGGMKKLQPIIEKEVKERCLVISNTFSLPSWQPIQQIPVGDLWKSTIYVYKKHQFIKN